MTRYAVVIPTVGRPELLSVLADLHHGRGPKPDCVVVVDDRPGTPDRLPVEHFDRVRIVRAGGVGPAAARNAGWRSVPPGPLDWIAFLDDDVRLPPDWPNQLITDLAACDETVAASQAALEVPLPSERRPTDDERGTAGLATARWITADMAYRRAVLIEVGGFDERFPRAYREDADLALRVVNAGYRIVRGRRRTVHPAARRGPLASLRAQAGNADNALMRRKHGPDWRAKVGEGRGRLGRHVVSTVAGIVTFGSVLAGRRREAAVGALTWLALTVEFAGRRIVAGPPRLGEIGRMLLTSVLIPPAACWHRLAGELRHHTVEPVLPAAVLFDRDDTIITDVPYLADPAQVRPVPGAEAMLRHLRELGVRVGVVSNQSGVASGLIAPEQLRKVNAEVTRQLGPFDTWQVCTHGESDGCECRKPKPALVRRAATELGVDVRRCVLIGDTGADVDAALAAGARAVLVPTRRTLPEEITSARRNAQVAQDLCEAVRLVLGGASR
jgi:histidinol-phosphate phosphatase family protein